MKKKLLIAAMLVTLTACGGNETSEQPVESEAVSTEDQSEVAESSTEEAASGNSFTVNDHTYEVKDWEMVPDMYRDGEEVLAVEFTLTNNSSEEMSPDTSFDFKAEQETDATIEVLFGGAPEEGYKTEQVDMASKTIKPGATVDIVLGYSLLDENSPVFFRTFNDEDLIQIDPQQ